MLNPVISAPIQRLKHQQLLVQPLNHLRLVRLSRVRNQTKHIRS
ncbi:hypothetical protein OESDEN_05939 [Oesophagostomum dentatum]|uniref:Uncharacterized protein n=1 Tax=Oesophagostomum dentatum TaxID=61180 RepID=A0A0B1TDI7_OESDE|nr:hypothetical protein OESDEN_05939 [Oesophagostomum dentatum]